MVRRRPWIAWSGVVVLAAEAAFWIGPAAALALGVVGAVLWVGSRSC
jgi:Na+/melibiose symporter-like transporter